MPGRESLDPCIPVLTPNSSTMTDLVARRKQFSSCDECRRLRVRCDALARGAGSGHPGASPVSCSRCTRRNERCTFEWMNRIQPQKAKKGNSRKSRAHAHARQKSASSTASTNKSNGALSDLAAGRRTSSTPTSAPAESLGSPHDLIPKTIDGDRFVQNGTRPEALIDPAILAPSPMAGLSASDARMARVIYLAGFDTIFGSWMSRYGCPFLAGSCTGEDRNSIAEVCERLDRWMEEMSQADSPQGLKEHHRGQGSRDRQAEESLHGTIAAFAARWLPLVSREPNTSSHYQSVIHSLWRHARRDMLRVINRISYRSILSLFLFALTPVPADVSEEEEADGIFGQVCIHAALQQIQTLRARQRSLRFNGTKVSQPTKSEAIPPIPETVRTTDFIAAENIAYYAALTFDTSASLTLNCQSLLAAGLFGFEAEMSWSLVRAGATMFRDKWQNWQAEGVYVVTDDRANQIIASGTAWKLLTWKLAAILKEALRDGHDESEVQRAFSLVVEAMRQFNDTYKRPLEACEQRMPFLGQHTKFRWYSLMLHYHLSILLMANAIEATDRLDLFNEIKETIASVESVVVNTLAFGLHNTTTMAINMDSGVPDNIGATETSVTVPLISIDPYPHHVVAAVQLVQVAIDRELEQRKITHSGHASVRSVLERALNHLPQSKSVKAARESFSKESHYSGEPPVPYSI